MAEYYPVGTSHASLTCGFCGFGFLVPIADAANQDCPRCLDEFAKAALSGMLAEPDTGGCAADFAKAAYIYANAMFQERKKYLK